MSIVFDVTLRPVDRCGEKRAQNKGEQHPVLEDDIGRQHEEIETDVLVVERILCTIGYVIEKLQKNAPIAGFCSGDQQSQQTCTACDSPEPRQPSALEREQIGRRHIARGCPRRGGDSLHRLPPGKTHRKPSVQPKDDGGRCPDSKKNDRFGGDRRQENLQKADRGKPQPIDQEVAREPEQEQANADGNGRNCEPDHGTLPWYLPSGSGDPDRHGPMIAEMRDACRLILSRDCASRRVIPVLEGTSRHRRTSEDFKLCDQKQPMASSPGTALEKSARSACLRPPQLVAIAICLLKSVTSGCGPQNGRLSPSAGSPLQRQERTRAGRHSASFNDRLKATTGTLLCCYLTLALPGEILVCDRDDDLASFSRVRLPFRASFDRRFRVRDSMHDLDRTNIEVTIALKRINDICGHRKIGGVGDQV